MFIYARHGAIGYISLSVLNLHENLIKPCYDDWLLLKARKWEEEVREPAFGDSFMLEEPVIEPRAV